MRCSTVHKVSIRSGNCDVCAVQCCEVLVLCDIGAVSLSQIQQPVTRNNAAVLEQILLAATAQSLRSDGRSTSIFSLVLKYSVPSNENNTAHVCLHNTLL